MGPEGPQGVAGLAGADGAAGPAGADGDAGTTGQDAVTLNSTRAIALSAVCTDIPGLSALVTVPDNSVVVASADGSVQMTGNVPTANALIEFRLVVDSVPMASSLRRLTISNTTSVTPGFGSWALSRALALSSGRHTIGVCGQLVGTSAAANSGLPTATPAALTVLILKK